MAHLRRTRGGFGRPFVVLEPPLVRDNVLMSLFQRLLGAALLGAPLLLAAQAAAPGVVYRCPGPPVLYTDALTPQEARERNCRTIEGAPVTIVQQRAPAAASAPPPPAARPTETRVDPAAQRARDSDARRILNQELRREEQRLNGKSKCEA